MDKEQLEVWTQTKKTQGFTHFAHHKPDSLMKEETLRIAINEDTKLCEANFLNYVSMKQPDEAHKLLNLYYIPLNISNIEQSCHESGAYTVFSICDFDQRHDVIDLIDYNRLYPDHVCSSINKKDITERYNSMDSTKKAWFVEIGNSSNKLVIFGESSLDITDDNFLC